MSPRVRLAILYGTVLFAASAVLVAIPNLFAGTKVNVAAPSRASGAEPAATQHVAEIHRFRTASLITLAVIFVVSIALGWFLSGWWLRRRAASGPGSARDGNYGIGGGQ